MLDTKPNQMFTYDFIGTILVLTAFFTELVVKMLQRPDKTFIRDTMTNFSLGIATLFVGAVEKGLALGLYSFISRFSFFSPRLSIWLWIMGFFGYDFIHYMYHRLGHKTRLLWASHVTHHSSLHFNLSIGWRVNAVDLLYRFIFWSPLCLVGVTPEMILFFETISAIYSFLIHTENVGKLGILDWIFNTPSNHRVHHGSNPEYIDKNMGGILVIFDHLFGTYARETSKPVYGITHNIDTHNPVKVLLHEYIHLSGRLATIKGFLQKLQYLFSPPQD
ncbi:MAG: C-5 sterol desaturase [Acidobacteria bacterium]|nr:MAG: C-5 sterol desaturase [Acidobacteriota bacterium]